MAAVAKTVTLRLDAQLHAEAVQVAAEHRTTVSALLRMGLALALNKVRVDVANLERNLEAARAPSKEAQREARRIERENAKRAREEAKRQRAEEEARAVAEAEAKAARQRKIKARAAELQPRVDTLQSKQNHLVVLAANTDFRQRGEELVGVANRSAERLKQMLALIEKTMRTDPDTAVTYIANVERITDAVGQRIGVELF